MPGVQLRALLIFDDAGGSLDTRQLAAELTTSMAAAGNVCDRMQEAGLVTVEDIATSRGAPCWVLTDSGVRLARWIKTGSAWRSARWCTPCARTPATR